MTNKKLDANEALEKGLMGPLLEVVMAANDKAFDRSLLEHARKDGDTEGESKAQERLDRIDVTYLQGLKAVAALQKILDAIEHVLARRAHDDEGESWAAIGAVYGRTKQAAQQKYGKTDQFNDADAEQEWAVRSPSCSLWPQSRNAALYTLSKYPDGELVTRILGKTDWMTEAELAATSETSQEG